MADILQTNFSSSKDVSTLIGTNDIILSPKGIESPFTVIDNANETTTGLRTLGTSLTQAVTKNYPIIQQETALMLDVVTNTTNETITYSKTFDFSSGLFDSGDSPIMGFGLYFVSGVATTSVAERTINISAIDTAGSPVTFSNGGGVDVDEFDYIIGEESGTQDLTGFNEAVTIPFDKLADSTTQKFSQIQIKFNLPVDAKFIYYKNAVYRTPEDCDWIKPPSLIFKNPKNFQENGEPNIVEVKGTTDNVIGIKSKSTNYGFNFQSEQLNDEQGRILSGNKRSTGGKMMTDEITLTIPDTYPHELSTQIPNLDSVQDKSDIFIQIETTPGEFDPNITIHKTGQYPVEKTVRFHDLGSSKRLRFSAADKGKKVKIKVAYRSVDAYKQEMTAAGKLIYVDAYRVISDNVDFNSSRRRKIRKYFNLAVTVTPVAAGFDNDLAEALQISCNTLSTSSDSVLYEDYYL